MDCSLHGRPTPSRYPRARLRITLLKIYIYGYLNRIQSSRRLEREAQRNVEVVWLTGRLMPDFKTIADFRKGNGLAIRKVCARFIELCREMKLFTEGVVAIDGSKFKAVNNRDRNFTQQKIKSRVEHLEKSVKQYLDDLDRADREPASVPEARVSQLKEKIAAIKAEMRKLTQIKKDLPRPEGQQALTKLGLRPRSTSGGKGAHRLACSRCGKKAAEVVVVARPRPRGGRRHSAGAGARSRTPAQQLSHPDTPANPQPEAAYTSGRPPLRMVPKK
jgi:hypothetical protein